MKWTGFMLSTCEFEKRLQSMMRHQFLEEMDIPNVEHGNVLDYFSELRIHGKKDDMLIFNMALHFVLHDSVLHARLQRVVSSTCCCLQIPFIRLNDLKNTCTTREQQIILFVLLIYFFS